MITTFISFFRRFFNFFFAKEENTKTNSEILDHVSTGDIVRLSFKDPRKMGVVTNNATTYIRFNPNELTDRLVKGTVTRLWFEGQALNTRLIEVAVIREQGSVIRKMLFLEEELETIERL